MAELPLDQAIPRFKANEDRVDTFVNGDETESYTTSDGIPVPSIRKLTADIAIANSNRVNTFADLASLSPEQIPIGGLVHVTETGSVYERVSTGGDLDYTGSGGVRLADLALRSETVTVGSGGDYATISSAIAALSTRKLRYKQSGVTVEIRLLAGFVVAEQIFTTLDLSFIKITSEEWDAWSGDADDEARPRVPITAAAITAQPTWTNWRAGVRPVFAAMGPNAAIPFIACGFEFTGWATYAETWGLDTASRYGQTGIWIGWGASGRVERRCGVRGAGYRGLYLDRGSVYARATWFDDCGYAGGPGGYCAGIRLSNGSIANIREAKARRCAIGLYAAACQAVINDCNFAGALIHGASNQTGFGILAQGGAVIFGAGLVNASSAARSGVTAEAGAMVDCEALSVAGAGNYGVVVKECGVVRITANGSLDASGCALRAVLGINGRIEAVGANLRGAGDRAVSLTGGSAILRGADTTGAVSVSSIQLYSGAVCHLEDAVITGSVKVTGGSRAYCVGATAVGGGEIAATIPFDVEVPDGAVIVGRPHISAAIGDVSTTLTAASRQVQIFASPLTTNRALTLPSPGPGRRFRIVRAATATDSGGTRYVNVSLPSGGGTIKQLSVSQWVDVETDSAGTAWVITGAGSL